jgi:outer membrane immunogenic protein
LVAGCGGSGKPLFASSSGSTIKAGWVAGDGVEWMMVSSWSVRAEWLHVDLGITSTLLTIGGSGEGTQSAVWSRNEEYDEFRVGLNYLFR